MKVSDFLIFSVTELLVKHGASVNVCDLWRFTPLHEGSAKGKYEIVKLLLKHGADPTKKNRDGHTPMDLVKEGDQDVLDLLRGDSALLDAAKKGNLSRVQKLLTPENINCRDSQGRNSTPLHLAAGYNNLEVAEFLLENGADVNAQDKGGLIPLHNASSYGHLDIAALLIRLILQILLILEANQSLSFINKTDQSRAWSQFYKQNRPIPGLLSVL